MKASKQSAAAYWHSDFRVVETLPDTKVIRTSFAVNAVAIAAVLGAAAFLYSRESALAEVRAQIGSFQEKIDAAQPRVVKAFELQREFVAGEKKVREVETFLAPKLVASGFLAIVSETLPRLISLDSIEMSADGIRLRGTVVGSSERSAPLPKAYAEQLGAHPVLKEQMASIKLNNQYRDQAADRFTFDIELRFKAAKPAPVAPKKAPAPSSEDLP